MGVSGWRERQDPVTISGMVTGHAKASDGDWTIMVQPDPASRWALKNAHGADNEDGLVECEVEPSEFIEDGPVESWEPVFFGRLVGHHVTVTGTWSDDLSHADKTEIHPIVSIVADRVVGDSKYVQIFAFADDSGNTFATVPHSGVSRIAHLRIPFAPHPVLPHHQATPKFSISGQWYFARSRQITIDQSGPVPVLDVLIETGVADDHQGFYFGNLALTWDDVRLTIPYDVIPPSPRLRITHIERSWSRSLRGVHHASYISAVGGTDGTTYWKLRKEVAIVLLRSGTKSFYTEDASGDQANVEIVEPHRTPDDEFFFPFLRTESDGTTPNNLLSLPPCPVFLDEL